MAPDCSHRQPAPIRRKRNRQFDLRSVAAAAAAAAAVAVAVVVAAVVAVVAAAVVAVGCRRRPPVPFHLLTNS